MADVLEIHTNVLLREIDRLKVIFPELEDDPALLADTVEGQTRFDWLMNRLNVAYLEVVALKEGAVMLQQTMKDRAERFDRRSDGIKGLMLAVMRAAQKDKVILPSGTVSIAKGKPRLELDEDFHAQGYMRVKEEPMRTDILAALQAGNEIPGARVVPSPDHLQVRTK
jgi:hypothetical protein